RWRQFHWDAAAARTRRRSPRQRGAAVGKRIVVNAGVTETRVGVQEGNLLTELYLERHRQRSIVGSVYKGVVTNVLPGMQAAFVDIGLHKDGFLYAGDYTINLSDYARAMLAGRAGVRLRPALRALPLPACGFILRTNAEGKGEAEFANDVEFLSRLWAQIQARFASATAPAALHEEGDLTFRVVRDLLSRDVDEFVVDAKEVYDKCLGYVEALVPALAD